MVMSYWQFAFKHELDHLNGVLFVDYLSPLKLQRIKKKLEKEARLAKANS